MDHLDFTFVIVCGSAKNNPTLEQMITSITDEDIPKCQILIAGKESEALWVCNEEDTREIRIFEVAEADQKNIAKKKNMGAALARYDNIVYMHDYMPLVPGWYNGFLKFTKEHPGWQLAMNVIIQEDGTRFRDWISFDDPKSPAPIVPNHHPDIPVPYSQPYLPPYDFDLKGKYYINGSYWVAKTQVMKDNPLNVKFEWGQPEDIEWSYRVRDKYAYYMNTYSAIQLTKQKDNVWGGDPQYITNEYITKDLL